MTLDNDTFDLDNDEWDHEDALGIARMRYLMSLVVLPYVCRYMTYTGNLGAVVDDAAMRVYLTHEPGTPLDIDGFVKDYIQRVERPLGRKARSRLIWSGSGPGTPRGYRGIMNAANCIGGRPRRQRKKPPTPTGQASEQQTPADRPSAPRSERQARV
jgi:hypothetical protein